jgi:hypothetical protein
MIWVSPSGDYAIVNSNHIPDGTPASSLAALMASLDLAVELTFSYSSSSKASQSSSHGELDCDEP